MDNEIPKNNVMAFKTLIERYNSITREDIKNVIPDYSHSDSYGTAYARVLTGFGSIRYCTLCLSVNGDCSKCLWAVLEIENKRDYKCLYDETYDNIADADSSMELLVAFKKRASYMAKKLKEFEDGCCV